MQLPDNKQTQLPDSPSDRSKEEILQLTKKAKRYKKNASIQLRVGIAHKQAGNMIQAERYLNQALHLNPTNHEAMVQLSLLYLEQGVALQKKIREKERLFKEKEPSREEIQELIELLEDAMMFSIDAIMCDESLVEAWALRTWCLLHEARQTKHMEDLAHRHPKKTIWKKYLK
jgi:tetratricopeptide (TPR) repeat protein